MRNYINEQGEGRNFHITSVQVHEVSEPRTIIVDLQIGPTGAEQLDPFVVSAGFDETAAAQLVQAMNTTLTAGQHR